MSETKKTLTKNLSSAQREFVIILIQSIWPVGCVSHWRPNHRLISADSVPPHSTLCAFGCWRRGSTGKCGSHVQLYSAPVAVAAAAAAAGKMWGRQFLAFGRQGFIRRENWLFHINPLMIINSGCHVFSSSNLLQKAERERTGVYIWWRRLMDPVSPKLKTGTNCCNNIACDAAHSNSHRRRNGRKCKRPFSTRFLTWKRTEFSKIWNINTCTRISRPTLNVTWATVPNNS